MRFWAHIGPFMKPIRIGATEYIVTEGEYAAESKNRIVGDSDF